MLPAERGEVCQQVIRDVFGLAQGGDGTLEIAGVPQDDGGHDEVEAGGAMLLVFVGPIANFPETMDEYRPGQAVTGLTLVELLAGFATQLGIFNPVEGKKGSLQPSQLS